MKRTIIKIDEDLCNGCGDCVVDCHEGALQVVDGKARLISETYCDGLGACIGTCPVGAITLEEREAEPFVEPDAETHTETHAEQPCCNITSQLNQWPLQLYLINPEAYAMKNADWVLAADCTAFAFQGFHNRFIKNNYNIAIACPKLDHTIDMYIKKLAAMIDNSSINTLTVLIMEVPCCKGLLHIALEAQSNATRKIPVKETVLGINGSILSERWV